MLDILAVLCIIAACFFLVAALLGVRNAPDALTRANSLGTMTSIAVPLLLVASLLHDAALGNFSVKNLIVAILAILGVWTVTAVAGFVMGRSLYEVQKEQ